MLLKLKNSWNVNVERNVLCRNVLMFVLAQAVISIATFVESKARIQKKRAGGMRARTKTGRQAASVGNRI